MLLPLPSKALLLFYSFFCISFFIIHCVLSLGSYEGLNDAAITSIFRN